MALYRVSKIDYSNYKGLSDEQKREVEENYISQGLLGQMDTVKRYVDKGEIVAEFKEIISGTRKKDDEKGTFHKVMRTCVNEKAHLIISTVDRLARNTAFALKVLDELEQHDLKIVVADLPQLDRMGFMIYSMMSEYEWRKCSERQKRAADMRRKYGSRTGKPVGNPNFAGHGKKRREINRKLIYVGQRIRARSDSDVRKRQALGLITHLKENKYSMQAIADELNKHGYRTTTGKTFEKYDVHRIWHRRYGILEQAQKSDQELYS